LPSTVARFERLVSEREDVEGEISLVGGLAVNAGNAGSLRRPDLHEGARRLLERGCGCRRSETRSEGRAACRGDLSILSLVWKGKFKMPPEKPRLPAPELPESPESGGLAMPRLMTLRLFSGLWRREVVMAWWFGSSAPAPRRSEVKTVGPPLVIRHPDGIVEVRVGADHGSTVVADRRRIGGVVVRGTAPRRRFLATHRRRERGSTRSACSSGRRRRPDRSCDTRGGCGCFRLRAWSTSTTRKAPLAGRGLGRFDGRGRRLFRETDPAASYRSKRKASWALGRPIPPPPNDAGGIGDCPVARCRWGQPRESQKSCSARAVGAERARVVSDHWE